MARGLVCVPCKLFYRVERQGVAMEEGMPKGELLNGGSETWGPYKLWMADLHKCPGCGHELLAGFGHGPINEHYKPDYARDVAWFRPMFRVDDCGGSRP